MPDFDDRKKYEPLREFWPGAQTAIRLIIIGEPPLDKNAKAYLESLRKQFSLPVDYQQFDMNSSRLV